jgi:hypothetical protein
MYDPGFQAKSTSKTKRANPPAKKSRKSKKKDSSEEESEKEEVEENEKSDDGEEEGDNSPLQKRQQNFRFVPANENICSPFSFLNLLQKII